MKKQSLYNVLMIVILSLSIGILILGVLHFSSEEIYMGFGYKFDTNYRTEYYNLFQLIGSKITPLFLILVVVFDIVNAILLYVLKNKKYQTIGNILNIISAIICIILIVVTMCQVNNRLIGAWLILVLVVLCSIVKLISFLTIVKENSLNKNT